MSSSLSSTSRRSSTVSKQAIKYAKVRLSHFEILIYSCRKGKAYTLRTSARSGVYGRGN